MSLTDWLRELWARPDPLSVITAEAMLSSLAVLRLAGLFQTIWQLNAGAAGSGKP